jgi:hypothetical protein
MKTLLLIVLMLVFSFVGCGKAQSFISEDQKILIPTQTEVKNTPIPKKDSDFTEKDFQHLKSWVGKYPVKWVGDKNKSGDFFGVPEVKTTLVEILGQNGFQNLLRHFKSFDLIKEKAGFLVMLGNVNRKDAPYFDYGMVAFKLETGEAHIFFVDDGKLSSFSNVKGNGTLPIQIKEEILIYADVSRSQIIGTIKQKPEGFGCYAVKYEDWEVWDYMPEKRPYLFIRTDEGEALMNIEGQDVLLKYIDSIEHKSEKGKSWFEWIYGNENVRSTFELSVTDSQDEGKHLSYDGKVTVSTHAKTQTIQIKATCYD